MSAIGKVKRSGPSFLPLVEHGPSRMTRIVPVPGDPWPIHIYSPAFQRNPTAPKDDQIPLWITHDPHAGYRRVILVEGVNIFHALGRTDVDFPVPSGIGGGVVAAVWTDHPFDIITNDPWNWGPDGMPPWVALPETFTRADLYKEVVRLYTKAGK